jgi:hypothetical protein
MLFTEAIAVSCGNHKNARFGMLKPAVNTETTELIGLRKYDIHIPCEQRFYSTDFEPA